MTFETSKTEFAVVGAGLSGLAVASLLTEAGRDVLVLEALDQPGGRIRSVRDIETGSYLADLGPTWVWPAFQPTLPHWIGKLGLSTFAQYDEGLAVLDHGPEHGVETRFLPGQSGNMRLVGGPQAMIDSLTADLPEGTLKTGAPVVAVDIGGDAVRLDLGGCEGGELYCEHLIVAIPPRIALERIDWRPRLPVQLTQALEALPTWMAPHAKMIALYDQAFWRTRGLSGRIASRAGPIMEAHDHSGPDGEPAAIFGFLGWPHHVRKEAGADLERHLLVQLKRCFGEDSPAPLAVHIQDWAENPWVTTAQDLAEPIDHPRVGPAILRSGHAGGRLWFAGSETAERSPGLIEGALIAAEQTVAAVLSR